MKEISSKELSNIEDFYQNLHAQHGDSARACDYGTKDSQYKKFSVLFESFGTQKGSLLDVGCGLGDFYDYLNSRGAQFDYEGIDITKSFIEKASLRFPKGSFSHRDFLSEPLERKFDIVTANGIFYLLKEEPFEKMKTLIANMYQLCDVILSFTSLSSWAPDQSADEFYADPLETLKFCQSLSPYVALKHDYHKRDFLITIRREQVE